MIDPDWRAFQSRIKDVGQLAANRARATGVPFYYTDASLGIGIVKEYPDGSRELIEIVDGEDRFKARLEPRAAEREPAE